MFVFSKLQAARVATEMSYHAARRSQNDVHKSKLGNVALSSCLASCKLQGSQRKYCTVPQSDTGMRLHSEAPNCCIMLALSKFKVTRVPTEMSHRYTKQVPSCTGCNRRLFLSIPLPSLGNTKKNAAGTKFI